MPKRKEKQSTININAISKVLKIYILPIVSMGLFILIVLIAIIPKVGEIFVNLDEIETQNQAFNKAEEELGKLEAAAANSNLILAQMKVVNETTPTGNTEVVKFRDKITQLTQLNSLNILSQRLSENNLGGQETDPENPVDLADKLTLQEVPFSFEIEGEYPNLIAFINDLSVIDDFIIVREMALNASTTAPNLGGNIWVLKLTINKYQFSQISQEKQDVLFSNVPIDAEPSQNVLEYVNSRIDD